NKALVTEVSAYLMMAVYKMFRLLYTSGPHNAASMFRISEGQWDGYSDAVMRMAEANVSVLLAGGSVKTGEGLEDTAPLAMTTESLTREFPLYTSSLLNLVKTSETRIRALTPPEENKYDCYAQTGARNRCGRLFFVPVRAQIRFSIKARMSSKTSRRFSSTSSSWRAPG